MAQIVDPFFTQRPVEAGKFGGAGNAQPLAHRGEDRMQGLVDDRQAGPPVQAGHVQGQRIALHRTNRQVQPVRFEQFPARMAGRQDDRADLDLLALGAHADNVSAAVEQVEDRRVPLEGDARRFGGLCQPAGEQVRVARFVVRIVDRARDPVGDRGQQGLARDGLRSVQDFQPQAGIRQHFAHARAFVHRLGIAADLHRAAAQHVIGQPAFFAHGTRPCQRVTRQGEIGTAGGFPALAGRIGQKAQSPGHQAGQGFQAQLHGRMRVGQGFEQLPVYAGRVPGFRLGRRQRTGIGKASALRRPVAGIQNGDTVPALAQRPGGGDAGQSGTDD